MSRFPTPEHLVSWAKLCPRTIQSGTGETAVLDKQGQPDLNGRSPGRRRGRQSTPFSARARASPNAAENSRPSSQSPCSILVVVWHLLINPATRFWSQGPDYHTNRVATQRRLRNYLAQLTAMGYQVTIEPAA